MADALTPEPPRAEMVLAEIRRIAAEELGVAAAVEPHSDLLTDLQLDSVGILTVVVGLENRFRVVLEENDAARVRTAGELADLVVLRAGAPS